MDNRNNIESSKEYINKWHGWYSETQKKIYNNIEYDFIDENKRLPGSNIYLKENGEEVEVTDVIPIEINIHEYSLCIFPDAIYQGILVKWVRHVI